MIHKVEIMCFFCNDFMILFPDLNAASLNTRVREREDDVPADMKIFIPYDSAKLCITQVRSLIPLYSLSRLSTLRSEFIQCIICSGDLPYASWVRKNVTVLMRNTHFIVLGLVTPLSSYMIIWLLWCSMLSRCSFLLKIIYKYKYITNTFFLSSQQTKR